MKVTILHLADLHCSADDELYLNRVGSALCKDIASLASTEGETLDLVCVTGDLVNKGQNAKAELILAESIFLKPLRDTLKLPKSAFFFTPGNHDVNRTQISKAFETGLAQELVSEAAFRRFYREVQSGNADHDLIKKKLTEYFTFVKEGENPYTKSTSVFFDTYILPIRGLKIGIASLNSAWRSSQYGDDARRLVIGEQVAQEAAAKVADCDIRLCLIHHPFEMLADWDCKPVRQTIAKYFHGVLNGHVHDSEAAVTRQLLGNVFVSTAGCMKANEAFSSYTIVEIDLHQDTVTCHFRKWYHERSEFDQETAKANNGRIVFDGFRSVPGNVATALQVAIVRGDLQQENEDLDLVCPMEGVDDVELADVFVQPVLTDKTGFDRDTQDRQTLSLDELLKAGSNLLLAGRPEFGKSTILRYARDFILRNDKYFDTNIPVWMRFSDLPKTTTKHVLHHIAKTLQQKDSTVESFAEAGQLTLLVDDFNDRQDLDHEKRVGVLRAFHRTYPKCRCIFTATEHLAQPLQFELLTLASDFNAQIAYIGSLNTARIRQLLTKWRAKQEFDLDAMLHQILYYFQHCQIPVTPLSVVLFLGVLFRKKKEQNIRNEAYLIENYLETILEKLSPSTRDSDSDFRDKEDFLAAVAWEMVSRRKQALDSNEFERLKLEYFEKQDEDLPHHIFFDAFFKKGILARDEGIVLFRRRFWLHFFVAKALEWSKEVEQTFLRRDDVLKFNKALAYKAGLSRREVDLLRWVDERAMREAGDLIRKYNQLELRAAGRPVPLQEVSDAITQQIREKNTTEEVDKRRDDIYLKYDEDKGVDEEQVEHFDDLLTLHSDIIRNKTKIVVAD